jgi:hypothetical protein
VEVRKQILRNACLSKLSKACLGWKHIPFNKNSTASNKSDTLIHLMRAQTPNTSSFYNFHNNTQASENKILFRM